MIIKEGLPHLYSLLYKKLNADIFNSCLPIRNVCFDMICKSKPSISVQHIDGGGLYFHVSGGFGKQKYTCLAGILGEMIHVYNYMNGVDDSSGFGLYRNRKFAQAANDFGFNTSRSARQGWYIEPVFDEGFLRLIDQEPYNTLIKNIGELSIQSKNTKQNPNRRNNPSAVTQEVIQAARQLKYEDIKLETGEEGIIKPVKLSYDDCEEGKYNTTQSTGMSVSLARWAMDAK